MIYKVIEKTFEDLIKTIERGAKNNRTTISNVKLWVKSWREELKINKLIYKELQKQKEKK